MVSYCVVSYLIGFHCTEASGIQGLGSFGFEAVSGQCPKLFVAEGCWSKAMGFKVYRLVFRLST